MSIVASLRSQLVPIHHDGYKFIAIFAVVTLIAAWIWEPLGWIGAALTLWCVYFFRDPIRHTPSDRSLIVSPADGIVSSIGRFRPPPELGFGAEPMHRISVFMSVFDCHVNRMPVAGQVVKIAYKPGLFVNADLDKASEDNERNSVVVETERGLVGVVQIAGLVARRILCFANPGDQLSAGQRFGLIRFGSRVDVYCSADLRPRVAIGSRAIAGETVLADFAADADAVVFRSQ